MTTSVAAEHSAPSARMTELSAFVPTLLLVGGTLNGFTVRFMESVRFNGADAILFGISPLELIVVAIAAHFLLTTARQTDHVVGWPDVAMLGLIIVPSSALSWCAVVLYAGYLAKISGDERRIGALLFAALGLTALWSSIFLKWFAAPITTAEAHIVAGLLAPFRPDITVSSNLIGVIGGHQVLLLPACASAYLIPKALVAFTALTFFMGTRFDIRTLSKIALLTVCALTIANWIRLAVMTLSYELYQVGHGAVGANIFDLVQTAIILAAGMWASR